MTKKPTLYGLVLLGGKSTRMGQDKSLINYHGQPQLKHVANLVDGLVERTYLSGRSDQKSINKSQFDFLPDIYVDKGPLGGLHAAFAKHPDKAWLVMAIDLPNMNLLGLKELVTNRDSKKIATAFFNPQKGFPEPLVAIWEPRSAILINNSIQQNHLKPISILLENDVKLVTPSKLSVLENINTQEDLKRHGKL